MLVSEFLLGAEAIYHKYFPRSKCNAAFDTHLYRSISIQCYLANKKEDCPNNYFMNDMFKILFFIQTDDGRQFPGNIDENSELPENLQMEAFKSFYSIKPSQPFMAYESKKMPYRKVKGTPEKLLCVFGDYCGRLRDEIIKDFFDGLIHKDYADIVNAKVIHTV